MPDAKEQSSDDKKGAKIMQSNSISLNQTKETNIKSIDFVKKGKADRKRIRSEEAKREAELMRKELNKNINNLPAKSSSIERKRVKSTDSTSSKEEKNKSAKNAANPCLTSILNEIEDKLLLIKQGKTDGGDMKESLVKLMNLAEILDKKNEDKSDSEKYPDDTSESGKTKPGCILPSFNIPPSGIKYNPQRYAYILSVVDAKVKRFNAHIDGGVKADEKLTSLDFELSKKLKDATDEAFVKFKRAWNSKIELSHMIQPLAPHNANIQTNNVVPNQTNSKAQPAYKTEDEPAANKVTLINNFMQTMKTKCPPPLLSSNPTVTQLQSNAVHSPAKEQSNNTNENYMIPAHVSPDKFVAQSIQTKPVESAKPTSKDSNLFYVYNPHNINECNKICEYLLGVDGSVFDLARFGNKIRNQIKLTTDFDQNMMIRILPKGNFWIIIRSQDVNMLSSLPHLSLLKTLGPRIQFVVCESADDVRKGNSHNILQGDGGIIVPMSLNSLLGKPDLIKNLLAWLISHSTLPGNRWKIVLHQHIKAALNLARKSDDVQVRTSAALVHDLIQECHGEKLELDVHDCDDLRLRPNISGTSEQLIEATCICAMKLQLEHVKKYRHVLMLADPNDTVTETWGTLWRCGVCTTTLSNFANFIARKLDPDAPPDYDLSSVLNLYSEGSKYL